MIARLLTGKGALIAIVATFAIGVGVGGWSVYKLYAAAEIGRLKDFAQEQEAAHQKTIENLSALHKRQVQIAADNVKIEKVVEYVKDNRACDINIDTERLLDVSRTGLSTTATGIDEGLSRPAAITQRQQIGTCARDGIQYRQLKATYDGLRQFILDNWEK